MALQVLYVVKKGVNQNITRKNFELISIEGWVRIRGFEQLRLDPDPWKKSNRILSTDFTGLVTNFSSVLEFVSKPVS